MDNKSNTEEFFVSGMPRPGKTRSPDRRAAVRFPIEQEIRYRIFNGKVAEAGSGRTINMSSSGVLFTVQCTPAIGARVEAAIAWPLELDGRCALKLVIIGKVIRSEGTHTAIAIEWYEFRTRGIALTL